MNPPQLFPESYCHYEFDKWKKQNKFGTIFFYTHRITYSRRSVSIRLENPATSLSPTQSSFRKKTKDTRCSLFTRELGVIFFSQNMKLL